MFGNLSKVRLIALLAVALIVIAGATAFTASNTVPNIAAGEGKDPTVSGYTITEFKFTHNAGDANNIDWVAFEVAPDDGGPAAQNVSVRLDATGAWYTCDAPEAPDTAWICKTGSATGTQLTAADVDILDVVVSGADPAVP